ncbi:hypothetical protein KAR91_18885 [Candidatus Pacearchaeota archaeon]|nr:hypothetical protein [Candidatus Pacearchaeota archaeon]
MGQAIVRKANGTASIGDNWKWLQRDFEERPIKFATGYNKEPIRHQYINPVLKTLARKMRGVEKKHEATNPKAVLTKAFLMQRFETLAVRRDNLQERLALRAR